MRRPVITRVHQRGVCALDRTAAKLAGPSVHSGVSEAVGATLPREMELWWGPGQTDTGRGALGDRHMLGAWGGFLP